MVHLHNGTSSLVGSVDKGLAHLHLKTETTVLGIELILTLGLDLLDIILETPLEGLEDHVHTVGHVPLASSQEAQQEGV